jgi:peptide-methionine (S)-S-oxide reductase
VTVLSVEAAAFNPLKICRKKWAFRPGIFPAQTISSNRVRPASYLREDSKLMLLRPVRSVLTSGLFFALTACSGFTATTHQPVPVAKVDAPLASAAGKAKAVFAGGCFWGTQAVFERVKGVTATTTGYAGGEARTATYDQVTTETTGHAESVEVVYDPSKITYGQLLRVFFSVAHDPTQKDRQGPDVGTSYRSAIFYENDEQKRIAQAYIAQLDAERIFPKKIVTEVTPLKGFYRAEDYHQDYALKNPDNPYIEVCDRPKIEALKAEFPELFVDYKGKR